MEANRICVFETSNNADVSIVGRLKDAYLTGNWTRDLFSPDSCRMRDDLRKTPQKTQALKGHFTFLSQKERKGRERKGKICCYSNASMMRRMNALVIIPQV